MTSTNYVGVLTDRQQSTKLFDVGSSPSIHTNLNEDNMITFVDEADGTISVYRFDSKIMRINKKQKGNVKTDIFGSFESIDCNSVKATKDFILNMYK